MSNTAVDSESPDSSAEDHPANTVAVIGLILTLIAGLMCAALFVAANRLADFGSQQDSMSGRTDDAPEDGTATEPDDSEARAAKEAEVIRQAKEEQEKQDALRLQVLLLASATVVLNLVGLVLSIVGLLVPHRPRSIAVCGTILSLLLLGGVFGVMTVGALLTPA